MILAFTVYGIPEAKGSMRPRSFRLGDGRIITKVTDSNRNVAKWQQLIQADASRALSVIPVADRRVMDGPVRLTVAFYLPRPKKYQKRGIPVAHVTTPDWDKLSRAVGDALTGLVYRDDKQIVEAFIAKFYADVDDVPHVAIRVEPTAGVKLTVVAPAPLPLFALPLFEEVSV